ncbi:hypothetical protein T8A63_20595 (plasmid) [Sulfitobacter sp. OXR-159]|uniref:hypothetical protein n=1 Tax=Sulfitobacter sp. OXR-159 TaxID=3100174 RepID=UPI002AC89D05|nr:hypothetical protein [Sulfitobacter sp. OXR-159]WPZ31726.1 hypothetical protein T8A63_20595 [Sulfitobacter sp. OXR-159]
MKFLQKFSAGPNTRLTAKAVTPALSKRPACTENMRIHPQQSAAVLKQARHCTVKILA